MKELEALRVIDEAFSSIDEAAQVRALQWLASKYELPLGNAAQVSHPPELVAAEVASMTAKAVAMNLNAESGSDLAYAAAAYLAVVLGQEKFSRQEILECMRSATGFYKPSFSNNLSSYINGLCKSGVLIEVGANVFAVRASRIPEIKKKIGEAI